MKWLIKMVEELMGWNAILLLPLFILLSAGLGLAGKTLVMGLWRLING